MLILIVIIFMIAKCYLRKSSKVDVKEKEKEIKNLQE